MRTLRILLSTAVALCVLPVSAKAPWVKKAQGKGFKQIVDCKSCHTEKNDAKHLTELGTYLMDRKTKAKAEEVDLDWIKDYKPKK